MTQHRSAPTPIKRVSKTYLDLIDMRRPDFRVALHLLNLRHPIITHPDALRPPLLIQPLQRQPHLLPLRAPAVWTVYQEQIHIPIPTITTINLPHALHTLPVALLHAARRSEDLGRGEDLASRQSGFADGRAHFGLVGVELSGVDVAVAGGEGGQAGLDAEVGWGLVDAETEARDGEGGVGEGDGGLEG